MKKEAISVGGIYTAKVSGGIVPVKITQERWVGDQHKGWKGVNTETGRAVTIKSAQRLRAAVGAKIIHSDAGSADVAPGGVESPKAVAVAGSPVPPKAGKKAGKATKPAPKTAKEPKAAKPKGPAKLSGLDAAAKILAEARKPMNCKELVAEAFKRNLWKSEGATPEATISAAIIREIAAKGGQARFVKKDRGLFASAGKGA